MSWRDRLRPASFRGAEFFVEDHEAGFGRRTVLHEYPGRDKPYVEDLGRKARPFTVNAYVLGADYDVARDRLIRELEKPGPGRLVHPYLGELSVTLQDAGRLNESTREGGMARFSLTFIEAGEALFPSAEINTKAAVSDAADAARATAEQDFANVFSVDGLPQFVTDGAKTVVSDALAGLDRALAIVALDPAATDDPSGAIAQTAEDLDELVRDPLGLATGYSSTIAKIGTSVKKAEDTLRVLRKLFDFGSALDEVPRSTPSRTQQADNQDAIVDLARRTAVIEATRASADMEFEAFQDAVAVRTELDERLDALMADADSDDVYSSLLALRAAMISDITQRGADLARLVTYRPAATVPAIVLAYQLYGDAARDLEIVSRNRVRHPGFVPGGQPLEVLADG